MLSCYPHIMYMYVCTNRLKYRIIWLEKFQIVMRVGFDENTFVMLKESDRLVASNQTPEMRQLNLVVSWIYIVALAMLVTWRSTMIVTEERLAIQSGKQSFS